jgi:hypothetical protein
MIRLTQSNADSIITRSNWNDGQGAAIAVGLFAIANALETGLVAIAKAIAKPDASTDRHVAFKD